MIVVDFGEFDISTFSKADIAKIKSVDSVGTCIDNNTEF